MNFGIWVIPIYAITIHVAVLNDWRWVFAAALSLLLASMLSDLLGRFSHAKWLAWPAGIGLTALAAWLGVLDQLILMPPVLIFLLFGGFFMSTLAPGRTPLITAISHAMSDGPLSPARQRYTRRVTIAWSMFFVAMATTSALLAVYASKEAWSLFANLISYALILAGFMVEFLVRVIVLPEARETPWSFAKRLRHLDMARVRKLVKSPHDPT